ncbi:hypothetical protein PsdCFBP2356_04995 [Pseudomonas syringae pv. dysoxyli]|uniref:head-tail joining protein n=1 Tax=Pseudomonas syringae TaxID=317 RepID=UPI000F047B4B|nr:hypothetical protein [Pseudomonas syringae]NAO25938.1 hypothetical protein [Pseudomonas syringae pv. dysoxyli]
MAFRELIETLDDAVFDVLSDTAFIEGREVAGMFSAPWLQPKLGRINTGLREPHLVIRVADAQGVAERQQVRIDLPVQDGGGTYTLIRQEPGGDALVTLILRINP